MQDTPRRATFLYLLFTLLFSSVVWSLVIWSGHLGMAFGTMITAIMWCPALATLVTCRLVGRSFRSLAWDGWPRSRGVRDLGRPGGPDYDFGGAPPEPGLLGWGSSRIFTRSGIPIRSRRRPVHSDSISTTPSSPVE